MQGVARMLCGVGPVLLVSLHAATADARPVRYRYWTLERLAEEADALVVGEVVDVSTAGVIPAEETRWHAPVLRRCATVRVLRSMSRTGTGPFAAHHEMRIGFLGIDRERGGAVADSAMFPVISEGEVTVFPLRKPAAREDAKRGRVWELIGEEDFGLLAPAVRGPPRAAKAKSPLEFLRLELAGCFARGERAEAHRGAEYLGRGGGCTGESLQALLRLVSDRVKDDEARWLGIAAACYCSSGVPRPKLAELKASPHAGHRPELALAVEALDRMREPPTLDRFVEEAFEYAAVNPWGVAVMIGANDPRNPTAMKLLTEALRAGRPEAVYIAHMAVKDAAHPVLPAAVDAARKLLPSVRSRDEFGVFRAACLLIRRYGSDQDFDSLLADMRKAKADDRARYIDHWRAREYDKHPRLIEIIRLAIDDASDHGGMRLCDTAAFHLESVTGEDFGAASGLTLAERDEVVAKARAWLAAHPPKVPAAEPSPDTDPTLPRIVIVALPVVILLVLMLLRRRAARS